MSALSTLGLAPSFGFGDRLGLATPGHVAALREAGQGILPIFAQQSIREMTRTGRSAVEVVQDALAGAKEAGYTAAQGADADHLKTPADIDRTAAAGFVFFTLDPSDYVDKPGDPNTVAWVQEYRGKKVKLTSGTTIDIDDATADRAAKKYGVAVNHAIFLSKHIDKVMAGKAYEIELSVDETPQPTTLAEHFIVADRCLKSGMKLVSLAPRFIGDFEKGVDFKGDRAGFEKSLADHAAIAAMLGPYKLSLHSGSDKLSIYPSFARATKGRFHVKTAGTSYLEALRAVLRVDEKLFREIIRFSRERYDNDKATYHVSATNDSAPPPSDLNAVQLEQAYLERWEDVKEFRGFTAPGRQIVHTTFGSVLTHPTLGPEVKQLLRDNTAIYGDILKEHFARHLQALRKGM